MSQGRNHRHNSQRYAPHGRRGQGRHDDQKFRCLQCGLDVSCAPLLSGVRSRNHCPFCLWSRHLDWHSAGDRLAGCRAAMRPLGLTTKHSRNKYAAERDGELMLIHQCTRCAKLVINRIAADDGIAQLIALFEDSCESSTILQSDLQRSGITLLVAADADLVRRRLLGGQPHTTQGDRSVFVE